MSGLRRAYDERARGATQRGHTTHIREQCLSFCFHNWGTGNALLAHWRLSTRLPENTHELKYYETFNGQYK